MLDNVTKEITIDELKKLNLSEIQLIDMQDEIAFNHGHIKGAINLSPEEILKRDFPKDQKILVCCKKGLLSQEVVEALCTKGYDAYNIKGGYQEWLLHTMGELERYKDIEKSIQKKFHKDIWSKFTKAINDYQLIEENDKIAVCISGGKDSMLMAKLFQELKRHNKFPFEVVFLVMDPGYSKVNRMIIENNAKLLNIPITIFESDIFESVFNVEQSPCYLCARMRRGHLYSQAKALGCNKIALGHHYDDVIETILMGMLYGGQIQTMMPKLHSTNFEGMELIRPLYLIREASIKHWRDYNDLNFIQCACKFTDTCTTCSPNRNGNSGSARQDVKRLIAQMNEMNPYIESNIFKSVENVNLNTIIAYKDNSGKHHFLDAYND